jgi:hypothetical protein
MSEKKVIESCARRALEVQRIYLEHKEPDLPNVYIYRKYIKPVYHISLRTFYRYLARNAKKEVRELEENQNHEYEDTGLAIGH